MAYYKVCPTCGEVKNVLEFFNEFYCFDCYEEVEKFLEEEEEECPI